MRLIDADAIHYDQLLNTGNKYNPLEWAASRKSIDATPTIDPVRHGKWISVPHKKTRICSVCECDEPYKFADEDANIFDYCPHCGTKMDAKEVWTYFN